MEATQGGWQQPDQMQNGILQEEENRVIKAYK